jgi:Protein of unknown function (DUF2026)
MAQPKFLIPLNDFNRIHQVAHGTLQSVASCEKSCIFFAAFGAAILNTQYDIPARVVAGAFGLTLDDAPEGIVFGVRDDEGHIRPHEDGFHMWVQTQTHFIDFMSPIYQEAFQEKLLLGRSVPRLMFQKEFALEASSGDEMVRKGDFFTLPDVQLTNTLVDRFFQIPTNIDLLEIALSWFGDRKSPQRSGVQIIDNLGEIISLVLPKARATGSW